jgi:energy-converting hydrogenase B subunit Q
VIVRHGGNITSVAIADRDVTAAIHLEVDLPGDGTEGGDRLLADLRALGSLHDVQVVPTMLEVYGKRLIVIGGGAQVGQVAIGAVSEADRHNIRGEKISIDTIPVVGEREIASAVRAVGRLPRAVGIVLAGSLMGGEITRAVTEVRGRGIFVISLNMPGSAADAADLVVTDPVQAGVMAVMAIAKTARFEIARQRGRRY